MRQSDIVELLDEVQEILAFLDSQIKSTYTETTVLEISKPKVKASLEHLRSCLDYAAHDIYEQVYTDIDGKNGRTEGTNEDIFPLWQVARRFSF
jgi:hypothetical protein